jgi:hypothetical protein
MSHLPCFSNSDIFNGARCKSYSWSQSHDDLEIRIKLPKIVKQDQISVALSRREICVNVLNDGKKENLINGRFEHQVDTETAFWIVEKEGPNLAVFVDKIEDMWWKKLLDNEEAFVQGPKNYTVAMDRLDEGSRMVIDKLVTEQRKKFSSEDNANRLSPA